MSKEELLAREKGAAKQRIFTAAASLFAQKGYAAVSVRDIADMANVNIAMINYYYGGKVGILKAIINECYNKYYDAVNVVYEGSASPEETVREVISNVIDFYRNNRVLAMVAFNTTPIDIPEILELKLKWVSAKRKGAIDFFGRLGLDTSDMILMSVIRGLLTTLIADHFQTRYVWEHILKSPEQVQFVKEHSLAEVMLKFDDAYYKGFTDILHTLYFFGLKGIKDAGRRHLQNNKRGKHG